MSVCSSKNRLIRFVIDASGILQCSNCVRMTQLPRKMRSSHRFTSDVRAAYPRVRCFPAITRYNMYPCITKFFFAMGQSDLVYVSSFLTRQYSVTQKCDTNWLFYLPCWKRSGWLFLQILYRRWFPGKIWAIHMLLHALWQHFKIHDQLEERARTAQPVLYFWTHGRYWADWKMNNCLTSQHHLSGAFDKTYCTIAVKHISRFNI